MTLLKVGILGNGNAAAKHRAAFAELPDLYEITSPDDADVVSICTPPYAHFPQASSVLSTQQNAIVEKPMCGSLQEADELAALVDATGKRVFPIFQYRFAPAYDPLPPAYAWSRPNAYYSGWRGRWTTALGGVLTSHGIHVLDRYLCVNASPPTTVRAAFSALRKAAVETAASVWLDNLCVFLNIHPDAVNTDLGDSHAGYVAQFRDIHRAIVEGTEPTVTLAQARKTIELLTACYYSAFTGQPVTLPIEPDHPFFQGWSQHFAQRSQRSALSQRTPAAPDPIERTPA